MRIDKFRVTHHATQRMAQRNLDLGDVALVIQFGRRVFTAGAKFYFLGRREAAAARLMLNRGITPTVPAADETSTAKGPTGKKRSVRYRHPALDRLIGTTVVLTHANVIGTVYRNRRALARIKRKPKETWKRNRPSPIDPKAGGK